MHASASPCCRTPGPGLGIEADIAGGTAPGTVHGAVLDGDAHAAVLRPAAKLTEDLLKARDGIGNAVPFNGTCKGGNQTTVDSDTPTALPSLFAVMNAARS